MVVGELLILQDYSPSNGWHYQPFAAASTLSAARAISELQVAREAEAHLLQSSTIAVDGDAFGRQSIIRADKRWGTSQDSGNPRSYCGHRPCTTKEKGRAPHC
jgi:hypothetical protein